MITFILGEDRHKKYFVHSSQGDYFAIKEAGWKLVYCGQVEAEGELEVSYDEERIGYYLDVKIQPKHRSKNYILELTLKIADEIIKNQEAMEVI